MRTRSGVGLAIFLLATFAAIAVMLLRQPQSEPIIQGKRLSVWLTGYRTQGVNPQAWAKADEILLAVGTNAIPTLLRMLRQQDSPFKQLLIHLSQLQHIVRLRFIRAEDRHYQAAIAFAKLGAAASEAVPALMEIANENISASSDFWSINALASIGPPASNAIPFLIRSVTNRTMELRLSSITALDQIRSQPELTVPALTNALYDQQFMVRYYAAMALGKLGPVAIQATPALTELLHDPDHSVRQGAALALQQIQQRRTGEK